MRDGETGHEIGKQQEDISQVCHLTARTSDNQCALHKAASNYPISLSHDQASRKVCLRLTPTSVPKTKTADCDDGGGLSGDDNQIKQQNLSLLPSLDSSSQEITIELAVSRRERETETETTIKTSEANNESQNQNSDQATMVMSENKLSNMETTKVATNLSTKSGKQQIKRPRRRRHRRFNPEKFGPTWPIAKRTLNDNSSFGDCEDISSPYLTGRLFHFNNQTFSSKRPKTKETDRITSSTTETGTTATTNRRKEGASLEEFLNSEQVVWQREQIIWELATCANSSYNHKRPFAQPFERPTAGWIYNAIGAERISKRTTPQSLKGKLLVKSYTYISISISRSCLFAFFFFS